MNASLDLNPTKAVVPRRRAGGLFRKYVVLFAGFVCIALLAKGLFEVWFEYQEHKNSLIRIQKEQAAAAGAKLGQFIKEIERQIGWTTQMPWSVGTMEERRFDALRLLRQVPAITDVAFLDSTGKERLRMSRLMMDVVGSNSDRSQEPQFTEAVAHSVYYGPVYFRAESEPYMTLALAGTRRESGVTVAEVNLKLMWDIISQIKVGDRGNAYVVDGRGRLIAHPNISLVLRNTTMSNLKQVEAARRVAQDEPTEPVQMGQDIQGRTVITAYAPVAPVGWWVFVELPVEEAYAPLFASLRASGSLLLAGVVLSVLSSLMLARRMVTPIRALQAGAARIGEGERNHRIQITTGDELEELGDQFNRMATRLQESYATLESKVIERTRQLELANLAKTRFLAAASHDLRQPLHTLGLLIGQLDADVSRADRCQTFTRISTAISTMNELFNALLDISTLDAGAVKPNVTSFPIGPLLRRMEGTFATVARENSLRLRVLPSVAWVRSDRVLLERILLNLVSNAIRYTDRGGIVVGCRSRGDALRIEVWDTGIGIPEDQRQSIFGEFYQVADARANGDGLGLGLAIVDRLCRLLDHSLELTSTYGKGSRFSITLARSLAGVARAEVPDPLQPVIQRFAEKFVVMIDDDRGVLESMDGLLRGWGCRVSAWTAGDAASAHFIEPQEAPDIIISDYHLSHGKTGIEVIERIRAAFHASIPALLITGDTSVERKTEAMAAGCKLLQKPVPPMTLRAILYAVFQQSDSMEVPVGSTPGLNG